MKLALHIGTARTGTTTLQAWCAANRAALAAQGVIYPVSPGHDNHRKLMAYAIDSSKVDGSLASLGIRSASDHDAFRSRFRDELSEEFGRSQVQPVRSWLMSSELLHTRINTTPMIARLQGLLRTWFSDITVYIHLRPQVDLLVSNATTRARNGRPVTRAELTRPSVSADSSFFNYHKIVGYWEDVFGAQNVRIIPYRRQPDITEVFFEELGLDRGALPPVTRLNPSLDWRSIALANVLHGGFESLGLAKPLDMHIPGTPGGEKLQLGREIAREVQSRFDASNARLARRRQDVTVADLEPDWTLESEEGTLALVEAPCLFTEQLVHVIRRMAQDRAMERWRRHMAEGRLAAISGDIPALDAAKRAAEEAARELDSLGRPIEDGTLS